MEKEPTVFPHYFYRFKNINDCASKGKACTIQTVMNRCQTAIALLKIS